MGVVERNGNGVIGNLRRASFRPSSVRRRAGDGVFMKTLDKFGMVLGQPFGIVKQGSPGPARVTTKLHVIEPPVRPCCLLGRRHILEKGFACMRIQMGLADQCRLVTCVLEDVGETILIRRQLNTVRRHPVAADALACKDRRPCRHADRTLVSGLREIDARGRQTIQVRRLGKPAAIAIGEAETLPDDGVAMAGLAASSTGEAALNDGEPPS